MNALQNKPFHQPWHRLTRLAILAASLLMVAFSPICTRAQSLTLVELNCENLFDTAHDSLKQDQEYLPESTRRWTRSRYWRKLNNLAQALLSTRSEAIPDLVALCEVENDTVMRDLCRRSLLRGANYEYVVTHSPDLRGIDVALLYSPFSFALISSYALRVTPCHSQMRPTRDILYACGRTVDGDTLHVLVVHAPSRYGGERHSRPFRSCVASRLGQALDSIHALHPEARIVVAGDFNDYGKAYMIRQIEQHGVRDIVPAVKGDSSVKGTYRYQGEWSQLDHVLVSPYIYNKVYEAFVHAPDFLLEEEKKYGGVRPRRTYNGYTYQPGYSDHLPMVVSWHL